MISHFSSVEVIGGIGIWENTILDTRLSNASSVVLTVIFFFCNFLWILLNFANIRRIKSASCLQIY